MLVDFAGFEIDPIRAKRTNGMGIRHLRHRNPVPPPACLCVRMLTRRNPSNNWDLRVKQSQGGRNATPGTPYLGDFGARASRVVQSVAQFGKPAINPPSELHTLGRQILVRLRLARVTTRFFFGRCPVRNFHSQLNPCFSLTWQLPCKDSFSWASGPELLVSQHRRNIWYEHFRG
jgi:hypothetical protein